MPGTDLFKSALAGLRRANRSAARGAVVIRIGLGVAALLLLATVVEAGFNLPNLFPFLDPSGFSATHSAAGSIDMRGAFFQSLGTNGRSCATCHVPGDDFGLSAADAQARNFLTRGKDPLFAAVDGSTCPTGRLDHSLVLNNGLFRIALAVPPGAEYTVVAAEDPYGCALITDATGQQTVSVYRRPLPATNLGFLSAVMFDGRETVKPLDTAQTFTANLTFDLTQQALDATLGHAQAIQPPTSAQLTDMVTFERGLNSAQLFDFFAGKLYGSDGSLGGPRFLSMQRYYPGINDSLGGDPERKPFDSAAFSLYNTWRNSSDPRRASIERGEQIFNTQPLTISDVPGLTTGDASIVGTCSTCHDTPNVGDHSSALPLDVGTSHSLRYETDPNIIAALQQLQPPRLPVFELLCNAGPLAGQVSYTSDPAKALISGKCSDIGRGKGPILRGLAARAPYFHNGAAANLSQVVNFYDKRFQIGLTAQQKQDLLNFLRAL